MKFLLLGFALLFAELMAQKVDDVVIFQEKSNIIVEYRLEASSPQEIKLYLSVDGGNSFSEPLKSVDGDVGKGIYGGKKRIRWRVLDELPELVGENIVFMVEIAEDLIWEEQRGRPRMEWVEIPAGVFMMGSSEKELERNDNENQHHVKLSTFKMSKYEVTFEQFDKFCEATQRKKPNDEGWGRDNRPVINVDWFEAIAFAEWMGCRLPTEAEWEYACRAGSITPFNTGSCLSDKQSNFKSTLPYSNCEKENGYNAKTMPVGSFLPNAWGLYDMHGNAMEWCNDRYEDFIRGNQIDPTGPPAGLMRVIRGGSWISSATNCRSAVRLSRTPSSLDNRTGFRLVFLK